MKHKALPLLLVFCLFFCSFSASASSLADSNVSSSMIVLNEYEAIVAMRKEGSTSLKNKGVSSSEISALYSDKIEQEFFRRAQLSIDELRNMGYNDKQIKILKSYDGGPSEDHPELSLAAASMTGSISLVSKSGSQVTSKFTWNWTTAPFFLRRDSVVCAWTAVDSNGYYLAAQLASWSCTQEYYTNDGSRFDSTGSATTWSNRSWSSSQATFNTGKISAGGEQLYAKKGTMQIKVQKTGTVDLSKVLFAYSYGHEILTFSGSLTPATAINGFSISIDWPQTAVSKEYEDDKAC